MCLILEVLWYTVCKLHYHQLHFIYLMSSNWDVIIIKTSLNEMYHLMKHVNIMIQWRFIYMPAFIVLQESLKLYFVLNSQYNDVTMSVIASQITSRTIVYSIIYSGTDQRKHQSSTSLAFVMGIHQWLVNSPHKGPVMRKMFPFDDVIMQMCQSNPDKLQCMHPCGHSWCGFQ